MSKLLDLIYKFFDFFGEKFPKLLVKENGKDATILGIIVNYLSLPILVVIIYLAYNYFWIILAISLIVVSLIKYRKYR